MRRGPALAQECSEFRSFLLPFLNMFPVDANVSATENQHQYQMWRGNDYTFDLPAPPPTPHPSRILHERTTYMHPLSTCLSNPQTNNTCYYNKQKHLLTHDFKISTDNDFCQLLPTRGRPSKSSLEGRPPLPEAIRGD